MTELIPDTYFKVKAYLERIHYGFKRRCCDRINGTVVYYWEDLWHPGSETRWKVGEVLEVYNDLTNPEPKANEEKKTIII